MFGHITTGGGARAHHLLQVREPDGDSDCTSPLNDAIRRGYGLAVVSFTCLRRPMLT